MKSEASWLPAQQDLDWIEASGRPPHPVLVEMEAAAAPEGIPILDRASGRVLGALAANRRRVVEVGTAIGYSTLWMALAQPAEGTIATIDPSAERTGRARDFWRRAGVADERVTIVQAKALEAFAADDPALAGPFDLAFIDALKPEYLAYLEALIPRLAPGALVVADNVLWSGQTSGAQPSRPGDGTAELRLFSETVLADPRFEGTILPVGDGLLVATLRP
ncbi:MAG: O-methyltransferase [Chloroflexota bacterium]